MDWYKICPACGERNSPGSLDCASCESDLASARVLNPSTEKALFQNDGDSSASTSEVAPVRICECGVRNPANARTCSDCGEDISDISPTVAAAEVPRYALCSIDGLYTFEINQPCVVVGREQAMGDYLSKKPYVSRSHARIVVESGTLRIENLSHTNSTYINNNRITTDGLVVLSDGDEIGLGGFAKDGERQSDAAYFIVRIA
jgi:ribosomal protein L40E